MDEARILIKAPDLPSDKIKCIYKNHLHKFYKTIIYVFFQYMHKTK